MNNNKLCGRENRRAHQSNVNQVCGRGRRAPGGYYLNLQIVLGLCVVLGAGLAVRADDTPAQAAARVALLQKLNDLDGPQFASPPAPVSLSRTVVAKPAPFPANPTATVAEKVVAPQTALTPATPAAAPAAVAAVAVGPVAAAPDMTHLLLAFLVILVMILALLLLKLLLQNSRGHGPSQSSAGSVTYPAQANPVTRCD